MPESLGFEIKRATQKQLYSIAAMTAHYFPYTGFTHSSILERLKNPAIVYLVALKDGHSIGFIDYELHPTHGQILGLAVLEEARGKGVAKALLEAAVQEIRASAKSRIDLLVAEDNSAAKSLYEKNGFTQTGVLDRKLWDKTVLVYTRKL